MKYLQTCEHLLTILKAICLWQMSFTGYSQQLSFSPIHLLPSTFIPTFCCQLLHSETHMWAKEKHTNRYLDSTIYIIWQKIAAQMLRRFNALEAKFHTVDLIFELFTSQAKHDKLALFLFVHVSVRYFKKEIYPTLPYTK